MRDKAVTSLLNSHLIAEAGVLTTNITSGEQWDAPNAWPPLVQMTIEGLQRANTPSATEAAVRISDAYIECKMLQLQSWLPRSFALTRA